MYKYFGDSGKYLTIIAIVASTNKIFKKNSQNYLFEISKKNKAPRIRAAPRPEFEIMIAAA